MKILTLHSDYIEFEAKSKALKSAESVDKKPHKIEECLVVLTSVEKRDEENPENVVEQLITNIKDISNQIKVKKIVLYPYAHLSSSLASPEKAIEILKDAENKLKVDFEVYRAPFGWYKSFNVKCKGHPLAELSREFGPEEKKESKEVVSTALKQEKKLQSKWFIITPDGQLHEYEKFDFSKHKKLQIFSGYEREKVRAVTEEPEHVKLMKKLELVDYEPGSDGGNLRYYPKGRLMKYLLESYINKRVWEYGGVEVETPIMYDMQHPSLSSYLNRFPARQYQIESDKKNYFLRFAACFGQFLIAHDATISYKNLPLKLYELTRYSFRREQRGELTGLRRLRAFTMPDCHALCENMEQAMNEYKIRFKLCNSVLAGCGLSKDDYELAIRVTKEFYEQNKELINWQIKEFGKPALIEMWDERFFYFVLKYELNFVDTLNKASALSTDQIDIENGERYGIKFTGRDGKSHTPLILHCSPSGAIERIIYALLEKAAYDILDKKVPQLPLWLCPSQIRLLPVSVEKHLKFCEKLQEEISKEGIRIDIDDNEESIGKRIRNAELEWVPLILVIGDNEVNKDGFVIRIRGSKDKNMDKKELTDYVKEKIKDFPFRPLAMDKMLSKRPIFVG